MNETARKKEDEYFQRLELERRRALEQERQSKIQQEERERLKQLHYMRCPKCGMALTEVEYKGIKIDKCFSCEGSWLDAGEIEALSKLEKRTLDKLFSIFKP